MMAYQRFIFHTAEAHRSILLALLSTMPFEGFEEFDDRIEAYIRAQASDKAVHASIDAIAFPPFQWQYEVFADVNWNAEWERRFKAVTIDDFCHVRAAFHPANPDVVYDIVIQPKMAFGTGHHETTAMMIRGMRHLDLAGRFILDYGCGTGLLSILACKMGASRVIGIDIDTNAVSNASYNAWENDCSTIRILHGDLENAPPGPYHGVLANINRGVLLDRSDRLYDVLENGGFLLLSGILHSDRDLVAKAFDQSGFTLSHTDREGEWISLLFWRKGGYPRKANRAS